MKRVIAFLIVFFLAGILAGCVINNENVDEKKSKGSQTPNGNEGQNRSGQSPNKSDNSKTDKSKSQVFEIKDYFPMKKNTRYIYEGSGNEFASYSLYNEYIDGTKVQQKIDNGGTILANIIELKNGKLTKVYSRAEVYYRENLLKSTGENEEILLMEPLKKGTTWLLKDGRVRTITGVSVDVITPTGSYKALEVTTKNGKDRLIDYYALNVGQVKSVFNSGSEEVTSILSKIEENVPWKQYLNFYFPNIEDGKIYYQAKELSFFTNDITRKILTKAYKTEANSNVGAVFSDNTEINSLYLNNDQRVYIDLNREFIDEMSAGAVYEEMILQSVVNTFGQYYNSQRVYLTIDNKPYESGHISKQKGEYFTVNIQGTTKLE